MIPKPLALDDKPCWVMGVHGSVPAGFPSPAADFGHAPLDLFAHLVPHPQATFYFRASGVSMIDAGIFDGDYLLVDRAERPMPGHIVVAVVDGDFTVKYLRKRGTYYFLEAANVTYPRINPKEGQGLEIWGVVRTSIHPLPGYRIGL